jgi:hypothetical protein
MIGSRRAILRAVLACGALALIATAAGVAAQPTAAMVSSPPLAGAALRDALSRGGYVLYFRHTSTDFGQNDDGMTSFDDCSKQRNLTDKGRTEARTIGVAITRLKIPVGEVLASPYCRTLETARLIFGRVTMSMDVRGGPATPPTPDRYDALRKLLSTRVAGATNLAIVSHGNPFYAVAGPPYLAEGEVAVVEPRGADGFRIVAKIPRDAWDTLDR